MNILFVNYGDFTTSSLNHIGGFANRLVSCGHACAVAVPSGKETLSGVPCPRFLGVTYTEVLAAAGACFPNGKPADMLHAWTPREGVRKFVVAHQRLSPGTRVVLHLEDNEEFLIRAFGGKPVEELRELPQQMFPFPMVDGLSHPVRYRHLLRLADGVTVIVDRLREFVPPGKPVHRLEPGVDFSLYQPQAADAALRRELGLRDGEKTIAFTGSVTFANAADMRELYRAVHTLNTTGTGVRLVRTGATHPDFEASLGFDPAPFVIELGFVAKEKLPRLLALADVLVQPGRAGAFNDYRLPSKLPEFLAMGRPVVLPDTNIGADMSDGDDALLLRDGSAAEIASACRRVFADSALARRLGAGAMTFARARFDLAANSEHLLAFYGQLGQQPSNPAWGLLPRTRDTELPLLIETLHRQLKSPPPASDTAQWNEYRAHLADLVRAVCQLDADLHERAREIADWRSHAAGLEQTRGILRQDIAEVRAHAAEHARQLEAEVRRVQQTSDERVLEIADWRRHAAGLEQARELTERETTRLQGELRESEHRVQRLQASFSWRSTAWLRALRRRLVDPYFGPPRQPPLPPLPPRVVRFSPGGFSPPAPRIDAHLDAPRRWPRSARDLTVRGWALSAEAGPLKAVRACIGGRHYPGQYGLPRPDVGHGFKHVAGAGESGFKLNATIEETDERIDLEAQAADSVWRVFFTHQLGRSNQPAAPGTYEHWVREFDALSPETLAVLRQRAAAWPSPPLISVLLPVCNPPEKWLVRAIESVRAQTCAHWELCIADDASTQPHVRAVLERYARDDARIKVVYRHQNGHISAASNSALGIASGGFCALMDHDDELAPHALGCMAEALLAHPDAELLYSDEDKIDETGHRFDPHFKPDWNPDLLTSQNYISHLALIRTSTMHTVGGFRSGFEGAQDWDLFLRVTERATGAQIHHLPRVLYHWRAVEGSTAMQLQEKGYAVEAARKALEEHFARTGQKSSLRPVVGGHWHVRRPRPEPAPLVTLVIPTRNRRDLLVPCVEGIFAKTAYPNFELLIADNDSDDPALLDFYERMKSRGKFNVLACPGPFNYSAINNCAVQHARGDLVGLLNNDLETMHPEWLDEMVGHAVRPEIGCVGAKLYYPDMSIQHAGVITGLGGVAGHAFKGFAREEPGTPQFRPHLVQNISAVTAACLVIRKSVYLEAGGFDEADLAVAFNDVDFCLKVERLGLRNLFTPFAELFHHESASRGAEDSPEKVRRFQAEIDTIKQRWGDRLLNDPAYNPNLTLGAEDFGLANPPRVPSLI